MDNATTLRLKIGGLPKLAIYADTVVRFPLKTQTKHKKHALFADFRLICNALSESYHIAKELMLGVVKADHVYITLFDRSFRKRTVNETVMINIERDMLGNIAFLPN